MRPNNKQLSASKKRGKVLDHKDFLEMLLEDNSRYILDEAALTPVVILMKSGVVHKNVFIQTVNKKTGFITVFRDNGSFLPSTMNFYIYEVEGICYR